MQILTIICHKNCATAVVFSAEPVPKFLLGVRLAIDKYTGVFSAKVCDEENLRLAALTRDYGCAPVETHRQPQGTWPDAVAWLDNWLVRQGYNVVQTVLREQPGSEVAMAALKEKFDGWKFESDTDAFILALRGWVVYACRDLKGEARELYWEAWVGTAASKVSHSQLKKLESWAFRHTRS